MTQIPSKAEDLSDTLIDFLKRHHEYTRHLEEGVRKRKPDLAPYRTCDDSRLKVNFVSVIGMCSTLFFSYIYVHVVAGD